MLGSFGLIATAAWLNLIPAWSLLALLPLPVALWLSRQLPACLDNPAALNQVLGANVAVLLSTLALLVLGISL